MSESLLVALGGNALIKPGQRGTLEEQRQNIDESLSGLLEPIQNGTRLVITHGNGPQVGYILVRAQAAKDSAYDLPLDVCVAQSQGEIGYLIQQSLQDLIQRHGIDRSVVTMFSQTLVDPKNSHFQNPTKPIGPYYSEKKAQALKEQGASLLEEEGKGFRRVVPSPYPIEIIETEAIQQLVNAGVVVITAGGGGIPVYRDGEGLLHGIEAVVDKDLASSVLAVSLKFDRILNLTSVDHAKLNYESSEEQDLEILSVTQAKQHLAEGHFAPGSMGPKIEAAIHFVEHGGQEFIITGTDKAKEGLDGKIGTHIRSDVKVDLE
jgi:carbamate kinase